MARHGTARHGAAKLLDTETKVAEYAGPLQQVIVCITLVCASRSPFEADTGEVSRAPYRMYLPDLRRDLTTLGDMAPPMASIAPYAILPPACKTYLDLA